MQAEGDLLQEGVADAMAVKIVHRAEAVESDEEDGEGRSIGGIRSGIGGGRQKPLQFLFKGEAVGEIGQGVVEALEFEVGEIFLAEADEHEDDEAQGARQRTDQNV